MVKNPHAGMVRNRPQGGGYLTTNHININGNKITHRHRARERSSRKHTLSVRRYPAYNGALLLQHYNTPDRVNALISLGNITYLAETGERRTPLQPGITAHRSTAISSATLREQSAYNMPICTGSRKVPPSPFPSPSPASHRPHPPSRLKSAPSK